MSEALLFAESGKNMLCTKIVLNVRNNFCTRHVLPRFELGIFMYWTMNNLSSYCRLVNAKITTSDKDLQYVQCSLVTYWFNWRNNAMISRLERSLIRYYFSSVLNIFTFLINWWHLESDHNQIVNWKVTDCIPKNQ